MSESRIQQALARIDAALLRLDAARQRQALPASDAQDDANTQSGIADGKDNSGSARVMALVNSHEKLREEVADTLRELDALIEELEE